ncbi:MAG: DUF445 domain-containing protein [Candidatus Nanopelagicales bacterium]
MTSLAPATIDDPDKVRALRRMKAVALTLLIVAAAIFLFAWHMVESGGAAYWGYIRAMAEAGVVGGLADWFAVTALFRHPLGLPIPHTALIPNKKDQLGESLSTFVHGNFLSRDNVVDKVVAARPAQRLAEYLDDPAHRERLVAEGASLGQALIDNLDDQQVQTMIRNAVFTQLSENAWGPPAGRLLFAAVDNGNHTGVVDGILTALHRWLLENRERVATVIADRGPVAQDGPIRWVHERIGYKAADLLIQWVQNLRDNPQDPARLQLDAALLRIADEMQHDPEMIERVERWKTLVLQHPETQRVVNGIWPAVKELVTSALADPDSDLRRRAEAYLADTAVRLHDDPAFAESVDARIAAGAGYLVDRYGQDAVGLISDTVKRWDASEASRRIEVAVGKDLQYIRINGTVVGALAGLVIYSIGNLLVGG